MEALLDEEETCNSKMRFIVLKVIPIWYRSPILRPACLTAVLGSRSSPSQRTCQTHHTRQRSLQLVGTSCTFGVPFAAREYLATRWTQSLVAPSKWALDHSVHDDYVCKFLRDDIV